MTAPVGQTQSPLDVYVDRVRRRAREPFPGSTVGNSRLSQLNQLADAELAALHGPDVLPRGRETWAEYGVYLAPLYAMLGDELDAEIQRAIRSLYPDRQYDLPAIRRGEHTMSDVELDDLAFVLALQVQQYAVLTVQREEASP